MFFFCQVIVNMGNNEMNWNYTNGAIKAQIAAAAKKAENNARAELVRKSAEAAAAARKARKNRETAAKKAANNALRAAANNALRAAAKKAENNARAELVRKSAEAAAAARKARKNREAVNEAFKKAAENARKAAEKAKKDAENAKKAAEKARKKKEAAENIKKNLIALSKRTNITKETKLAQGKKIYRGAAPKLHPNTGGNTEAFQILSGAYNNFKKEVNQK
jgi:hypothetical protein